MVAITGVEIIAAITRRSRSGSISITNANLIRNQFKIDFQKDYQVIEITETIINAGMVLSETYGLRGYDAIQLAAGRAVNSLCIANGLPPIIFVSADNCDIIVSLAIPCYFSPIAKSSLMRSSVSSYAPGKHH